jgi:hypothetical protein
MTSNYSLEEEVRRLKDELAEMKSKIKGDSTDEDDGKSTVSVAPRPRGTTSQAVVRELSLARVEFDGTPAEFDSWWSHVETQRETSYEKDEDAIKGALAQLTGRAKEAAVAAEWRRLTNWAKLRTRITRAFQLEKVEGAEMKLWRLTGYDGLRLDAALERHRTLWEDLDAGRKGEALRQLMEVVDPKMDSQWQLSLRHGVSPETVLDDLRWLALEAEKNGVVHRVRKKREVTAVAKTATEQAKVLVTEEQDVVSERLEKLEVMMTQWKADQQSGARQSEAAEKRARGPLKCWNCDKPGHSAHICKAARAVCEKCGESNHVAKYCERVNRLRSKVGRGFR